MDIDTSFNTPQTFSYHESDFKILFTGFKEELSKKEKDTIVHHFINFISKDIQKQLNRMIQTYKRFRKGN